ncbi:TonB-dependent siderophore receptor [Pseudoxanthomonas jiangsuensis]|uniref:TonB-dependent siderophore receptor n=1 Tax=Pseudoxanthomonas jiangsuensis TaxID=619688 RepID=UPI001391429A|nr:TonB-dependent siderophore receptor [Pseudoxanthomonas jiangsuensis]KAF1693625.1 TonB-dependent siderophore receptor [Pseudoxanthomonas jiangsuensis]
MSFALSRRQRDVRRPAPGVRRLSPSAARPALLWLALLATGTPNAQSQPADAPDGREAAARRLKELDAVEVHGEARRGVQVGKGLQDLREIPQSVSVIGRERIEQQALATLDDVMLQSTGVTREQLWLNNNYTSRGLQIRNIRYDGGGASSLQDRSNNADMAQYESVALLRGADGLFGAGEAGGVINLASKRPRAEAGAEAVLTLGRWDNRRLELDATGPLNAAGSVRGRAVGVFHDQDMFYEPAHNRRGMLYAALEWDIAPGTRLFAGGSWQKDTLDAFNASLPRWEDGADIGFPRQTTMGAPWGWIRRESTSVFAIFEQELGERWNARLNLRHNLGDDAINGAEMEGSVPYATGENQWWRYQDATDFGETTLDLALQGSFDWAGRRHDVIWGVDSARSRKDYDQTWTYYADGSVFDRIAPPEWAYPAGPWVTQSTDREERASTYGSLRLRPFERLAVIVGGRYTFQDTTRKTNRVDGVRGIFPQDDKFVPYYGLVYDLSANTSVYASRAEIYRSQGNYLAAEEGPALEPLTGSNIELGIKTDLSADLSASLALYRIRKEKEAVYLSRSALPNTTAWCCYAAVGSQRSEGVDLELSGRLAEGWNLTVGYTYNENEDRRDTGMPFNTVTPKHLFKAWTTYRFYGALEALELGGGVTAQSRHWKGGWVPSFNPDSGQYDGEWVQVDIVQKGYAVWSLRAGYDVGPRLNLALNLNNVFDETYYSTVGYPGYGNFYGEPRNMLLTARYRF